MYRNERIKFHFRKSFISSTIEIEAEPLPDNMPEKAKIQVTKSCHDL